MCPWLVRPPCLRTRLIGEVRAPATRVRRTQLHRFVGESLTGQLSHVGDSWMELTADSVGVITAELAAPAVKLPARFKVEGYEGAR